MLAQTAVPLAPRSNRIAAAGGSPLAFDLPRHLEAGEPPEARGLARDEVRLLVSETSTGRITHARFRNLSCFLDPGDLLVINTSGTLNAALPVVDEAGQRLVLHLSTRLPGDIWIVELRRPAEVATEAYGDGRSGTALRLPEGGQATLLTPYRADQRGHEDGNVRLWLASLLLPQPVGDYLNRHGQPIRYNYVREAWPSSYYQTVYATELGSAEMPSAGRAFTPELLTGLVARGIQVAPLVLHTGVASLEEHEPPYEEYYRVPAATARLVNATRAAGRRVVAVGTTAVRALETVVDEDGQLHPGEGWTQLVITSAHRLRAVNAMLTGLHEPRASHLAMLEALAGRAHLRVAYQAALEHNYLWHEFGDLHLMLT